jgi:hypothetical protein
MHTLMGCTKGQLGYLGIQAKGWQLHTQAFIIKVMLILLALHKIKKKQITFGFKMQCSLKLSWDLLVQLQGSFLVCSLTMRGFC